MAVDGGARPDLRARGHQPPRRAAPRGLVRDDPAGARHHPHGELEAREVPLLRAAHLLLRRRHGRDAARERRRARPCPRRRHLQPQGQLGPALHPEPAGHAGARAPAPQHRPGRGAVGRLLRHARRDQVRRHHDRLRLRLGGQGRPVEHASCAPRCSATSTSSGSEIRHDRSNWSHRHWRDRARPCPPDQPCPDRGEDHGPVRRQPRGREGGEGRRRPRCRDFRHRRGADRVERGGRHSRDLLGRDARAVRAGRDRRGQALLLREAAGDDGRGREAHRRRRSGARQAPRPGRLHAPLRRGLPHAEAGDRQRDRPAADGARRAPQPDGARAVRHADGDPRHADPRDRRVPLAARRRLCLGAGRLPARLVACPCEAQGPAGRPARDGQGHPHRRRGLRQLPLWLRHPVPGRRRGRARVAARADGDRDAQGCEAAERRS